MTPSSTNKYTIPFNFSGELERQKFEHYPRKIFSLLLAQLAYICLQFCQTETAGAGLATPENVYINFPLSQSDH